MRKTLTRLVAVLLIPCFLGDPATATAITCWRTPAIAFQPIPPEEYNLFAAQAFQLRIINSRQDIYGRNTHVKPTTGGMLEAQTFPRSAARPQRPAQPRRRAAMLVLFGALFFPHFLSSVVDFFPSARAQTSAARAQTDEEQRTLIKRYIEQLKESDNATRYFAMEALVKIGPAAIPALTLALKNPDSYVRAVAAEALRKIGPSAIPALTQALKERDSDVRRIAAGALGEIAESIQDKSQISVMFKEAIPVLTELLKDKDFMVCDSAAEALGSIGDSNAIPALVRALKNEGYSARFDAIALGQIAEFTTDKSQIPVLFKEVIPALTQALKDDDPHVRGIVSRALGSIAESVQNKSQILGLFKGAIPVLIKALKDGDPSVRMDAADLLGKIAESVQNKSQIPAVLKEAIPALIAALKAGDSDVRKGVAKALQEIGPSAIPALTQALKERDSDVRRIAAGALGEIAESIQDKSQISVMFKEAIPVLAEWLNAKDFMVSDSATEALGKIGDPSAIPALVRALKNGGYSPSHVASALGKIAKSTNDKSQIPVLFKEAIPALTQALKDDREDAAKALGEIAESIQDKSQIPVLFRDATPALIQALRKGVYAAAAAPALVKIGPPASDTLSHEFQVGHLDTDTEMAAIGALDEMANPRAATVLQYAAQNEFKNEAEVRKAAAQALQNIRAKIGEQAWNAARTKRWYENIYSLPFQSILRWVLWVTGLLIFAEALAGFFGYRYTNSKSLRTSAEILPFLRTARTVIPLAKPERTRADQVQTFLRFGYRNPEPIIPAFVLVGFAMAILIAVGVNFDLVWTWAGVFGLWTAVCAPYFFLLSRRGSRWVAPQVDRLRTACRATAYPFRYPSQVNQYIQSDAMSVEHYYLMLKFQKEQGRRIFDDLRKLCEKFAPDERPKVFGRIVDMAYRMSQKGEDPRLLLETPAPVAIEVSADYLSFETNLAVIEEILSGHYPIMLPKDRKSFRAFFEKVGKDLQPLMAIKASETIGQLEHRLVQRGFDVMTFYKEVFQKLDAETLTGSLEIINEILRQDVFPTRRLITEARGAGDEAGRMALYRMWKNTRQEMREGGYDLEDPLHLELEYATFRRIVDNSRIVSELHKDTSYEAYIHMAQRERRETRDTSVDRQKQAEIVYAAHEATVLEEFVSQVRQKARSLGREVLVMPNLSYGRFAEIFVEGDMRLDDVELAMSKIGSSQTHDNPYYLDPRFIRSQLLQRFVSEKPVIIVVDGSVHTDRYPDAYQGYLNLAIAIDDALADGDIGRYASVVRRKAGFIRSLRRQTGFQGIRRRLARACEGTPRRDKDLYAFHFWNPRGKALKTRSSWKTRRGTLDSREPMKLEELTGPAVIFVNTVLTDKDIPQKVKAKAGGLPHNPAYFDDMDEVSAARLFFRFDATGVHLADALHRLEMDAVKKVGGKAKKPRAAVNHQTVAGGPGDDSRQVDEATTNGDYSPLEIRRALDDLESPNSRIRLEAAEKMGEFRGQKEVLEALVARLAKEKDREVQRSIISTLGLVGTSLQVGLLGGILRESRHEDLRFEAARALGKIKDPGGMEFLGETLGSRAGSAELRKECVVSLRLIRDPAVLPLLKSALKDDAEPSVRSVAGEAFLDVGREAAVLEALPFLKDRDSFVRMMLIEGLGDLRDDRAVEAIGERLMNDREESVRERAAWALGNIGGSRAKTYLSGRMAVEKSGGVKALIEEAIQRIEAAMASATQAPPEPEAAAAVASALPVPVPELGIDTAPSPPEAPAPPTWLNLTGRRLRAVVLDLDDTAALLAEELSSVMVQRIEALLESGLHVVFATEEKEDNLEWRVWSLIRPGLRSRLHFLSEGGMRGFGFNDKGEKEVYYRNVLGAEAKRHLLGLTESVLGRGNYTDEHRDYKLKLRLDRKIRPHRRELAESMQERLAQEKLPGTVQLRRDRVMQIFPVDKADALRRLLALKGWAEEELAIIGNRARSFGGDRRLLTQFLKALSFNVGDDSPSIAENNPTLIQTPIKGIPATRMILDAVLRRGA
jgi:HEAT repeat protein